jgi:uncharacterized protein YfdQ (DUF2303 family)
MNDIEAAVRAGKESSEIFFARVNAEQIAVKDYNGEVRLIECERDPDYRDHISCCCHESLKSLIAYVNNHKTQVACAFVSMPNTGAIYVRAFLHFEAGGVGQMIDGRKPNSTAEYQAIFDRRFSEWHAKNKVHMTQFEFADWLEEHAADISEPPAAEILEIVTNFESHRDMTVESRIRLKDGSIQLLYKDQERKDKADFPGEITLKIPIFALMPVANIKCRIRYRVDNGKVAIHYIMENIERIAEEIAEGEIARLEAETEIPVYRGSLLASIWGVNKEPNKQPKQAPEEDCWQRAKAYAGQLGSTNRNI